MSSGKVYLIGAGPGDYKLLTIKALECLKIADVIVYDRLANNEYLKEAKAGCEFVDVGKASSNHTLPQDDINAVIAKKAKEGKIVVRLKGGDPYVFGRGGEEGEYLVERGVDFEVVPGITSVIGGLAYAGIPITHRDFASSFHVITGHLKEGSGDMPNWEAMSQLNGTLVFLMGVANLEKISKELIKAGKTKETPVALISWATRSNQSVVVGTLENIYEKALEEGVKPPTLIVIGEVVTLREKLNFFEKKPLFGKKIIVTRTRKQNSSLVDQIRNLGGYPLEFPTIQIKEISPNEILDEAIAHIEDYNYLVLTSSNAAECVLRKMESLNVDIRRLYNTKIAVIGDTTAAVLRERGILPDLMPEKAVGEELAKSLKAVISPKDKVLVPQSALARKYLQEELEGECDLTIIPMYETVATEAENTEIIMDIGRGELLDLLKNSEVDYITFCSSSTVKYFIERIGVEHIEYLRNTKIISIGEITSRTIRSYGLEVYKEAERATVYDMIQAMIEV